MEYFSFLPIDQIGVLYSKATIISVTTESNFLPLLVHKNVSSGSSNVYYIHSTIPSVSFCEIVNILITDIEGYVFIYVIFIII